MYHKFKYCHTVKIFLNIKLTESVDAIVVNANFSDQLKKKIIYYKRIGYNINIMRQSACLVVNPVTVNNFASLFNSTPMGQV